MIIVAMYIEPPFSAIVDGKFVGENIDIATALANKVGRKAKFVYCPLARCLSLLQEGHADMIVAVRKTRIRQQFLHYLTPAIKIQKRPLRFYMRSSNKIDIGTYEDLKTLRIGVLRGASYFDKLDHDTSITKIPLTNHKQLVDMLLKGRIDTFLEREESITPLVNQDVYASDIKLATFSYDKGVGSFIAISKKAAIASNKSLLSKALLKLRNSGKLDEIISKTVN
jgi:polar amino acid transport system substrate-binding protein